MCGCPGMESYEEFCLRTLAALEEKRKFKKTTCDPSCSLKTSSVIRFYGRSALSPLLNPEERAQMCGYRDRAVQQEVDRQNQQRNKLLARVQDILDQTHKTQREEAENLLAPAPTTVSGYTLVTDSPGLSINTALGLKTNDGTPGLCSGTTSLSGCGAVEEAMVRKGEEKVKLEEISLDNLLKKSREYVKREQGSKVSCAANVESPLDQENKSCSPVGGCDIEFGFSLHHSPTGVPQIPHPHQTLLEPGLQAPSCRTPCVPERYAHLPSPEFSLSPCARRRKPRPVSTGNIHISFPITPEDLVPRNPGRSGESAVLSDWEEAIAGAKSSSDHWGKVESGGNFGWSANHRHSPVSTTVPSPMVPQERTAAGFRRRCHTLDSQLHCHRPADEHVDRSQERVPRFMAGVPLLPTQGRRPPAVPLNCTYVLENPPLPLLRPHVNPESGHVSIKMAPDDVQVPNGARIISVLTNQPQPAASKTGEQPQREEEEEEEEEEEHALQMSLSLAGQEKEQQRLRLELEEMERRLKDQGCVQPPSTDSFMWNPHALSPRCPGLSPAHTASELSPGHSLGFPSPGCSSVCSPSVQSPVYPWGSSRAVGKTRGRLSLTVTAEQQRSLSRLGAIIRGFLTRRLIQTEKVKHLRQTIMDTQEFIRSFQPDSLQRRCSLSAQDVSLQKRVKAQLRVALYDIHYIFFEMAVEERLVLLQQDRDLRAERKLRDLEKSKSLKERTCLSAATQRSLDRKRSNSFKVGEAPAQTRKLNVKPKSPTTNRVLKPSQCQNSPVPGQLNRQGSWHRKTPEDRVKRSESLKKQHSLG